MEIPLLDAISMKAIIFQEGLGVFVFGITDVIHCLSHRFIYSFFVSFFFCVCVCVNMLFIFFRFPFFRLCFIVASTRPMAGRCYRCELWTMSSQSSLSSCISPPTFPTTLQKFDRGDKSLTMKTRTCNPYREWR